MTTFQKMVLRLLILCYEKLLMVNGVCAYEGEDEFIAEVEEATK